MGSQLTLDIYGEDSSSICSTLYPTPSGQRPQNKHLCLGGRTTFLDPTIQQSDIKATVIYKIMNDQVDMFTWTDHIQQVLHASRGHQLKLMSQVHTTAFTNIVFCLPLNVSSSPPPLCRLSSKHLGARQRNKTSSMAD